MRKRFVYAILVPCVLAQQQTARVEFEVAAIRLARVGAQGNFFEIAPDGERFTATNAPLRVLVMMAYGVADWQVSGGPGWMNSEYFDIEAKPERPASREQIFQMLRNLLSDRFQLKLHKEVREVPVYVLTEAGKTYGLRENRSGDSPGVKAGENGQVVFHGFSMAQLARYLSLRLRHDVTDKTELKESYDFELTFKPDMPPSGNIAGMALPSEPDRPSLPDALQEQLGLRLQLQKATSDMLIVDVAMKPSEN